MIDIQQIGAASSKIVKIIPGPKTVRVHESLDMEHKGEAARYFLSVDMKFTETDALRDWAWYGYKKAEATRYAKKLAEEIFRNFKRLESSHAWGDKTAIALAEEANRKTVRRYVAEVVA